jgi:hypothetical protein
MKFQNWSIDFKKNHQAIQWEGTFFFFFFLVLGFNSGPCTCHRQALYLLNHVSSTFCFSYFWDRVLCLCWTGLSWTAISLFMLPLKLGWLAHTTTPSFYWLRWSLTNFLHRLSSNTIFPISTSQGARITGMSHPIYLRIIFSKNSAGTVGFPHA